MREIEIYVQESSNFYEENYVKTLSWLFYMLKYVNNKLFNYNDF